MYTPAIMADKDSRASQAPKNSVWTGTITRGNVAVVNVTLTKENTTVPIAFPARFSKGRVPAKFKYKLSFKTKNILQDNEEAEYDDHK